MRVKYVLFVGATKKKTAESYQDSGQRTVTVCYSRTCLSVIRHVPVILTFDWSILLILSSLYYSWRKVDVSWWKAKARKVWSPVSGRRHATLTACKPRQSDNEEAGVMWVIVSAQQCKDSSSEKRVITQM